MQTPQGEGLVHQAALLHKGLAQEAVDSEREDVAARRRYLPRKHKFTTLVPRFLVFVIGPRAASKWPCSSQFLVYSYGQLLGP